MKKVYVSGYLLPLITCIYALLNLVVALLKSNRNQAPVFIITSAVFLILWVYLCFRDYNKKDVCKIDMSWACIILLVFFVMAYFTVNTSWGNRYMSLYPIEAVDNGKAHIDTLFDSSIAEGYSTTFPASLLINDDSYSSYHIFSHLIIWIVSKCIRVPVFLVYNYLFPVVFVPIYLYSQIFAVSKAKLFFKGKAVLYVSDYFALALMNIGIVWFEDNCGVWRSTFLWGQSFMVALTIMYFSYGIIFHVISGEKSKSWLLLTIIPLSIFLTTWSKVSVGVIFTGTIMYYLFRKYTFKLRYWLLNFCYGIVFFLAFLLTWSRASSRIENQIQLFAFKASCTGWGTYILHFVLLGLPGLLYLCFQIYDVARKEKKWNLWMDLIIVISFVGFAPVVFMAIPGGSAVYFSYAVEVPGIILLCGNDCLNESRFTNGRKSVSQKLVIGFILALILCNTYIKIGIDLPSRHQSGVHDTNTYSRLMEIRNIVQSNPKDYCLYLDSETEEVPFNGPAEVYLYPGLTGAMLINATYCHDGKYFDFKDREVMNYAMDYVRHDKLSYEEAVEKAREYGRKYLIRINNLEYEIIKL